MIRCEEIDELLAAYALDALSPGEQAEVTNHLSSCDKHPDAVELAAVASALAHEPEERVPPAALKLRIMAEVRGEDALTAATTHPRFLDWLRGVLGAPWLPYAMSGAAITAVALFALYFGVIQNNDTQTTFALTGDGGASGELALGEDKTDGVLTAMGLAPISADETFQVWALFPNSRPTPAGFLSVDDNGEASGVVTVDLTTAMSIAVTIEPAGGSSLPTSPAILSGDL